MRATGRRGGKAADPSVPSPPLRRSPCSSIRKGDPLSGWKNRGEAPRRWLCSEPRLAGFGPGRGAGHARGRSPQHKPPSGQRTPLMRCQARFPGSLGSCRGTWKPSLPRTGPLVFPYTPRLRRSPSRQGQSTHGRPGDTGPIRGPRHGSRRGGVGPGWRDARPWTGSPLGSQACAPPGQIGFLLWLKLPHTARRRKTVPSGFNSLKSGLNYARRDCDRCDLSPPELQPPSP